MTFRTLLKIFALSSQTPGACIQSLHTTNEQDFNKSALKLRQGLKRYEICLARAIACITFSERISAPPEPWRILNAFFVKIPVSSLYGATENKLQGSGMATSKNATKVLNLEKKSCALQLQR